MDSDIQILENTTYIGEEDDPNGDKLLMSVTQHAEPNGAIRA